MSVSFSINKDDHNAAKKAAKIRNMTKSPNENEAKVARNKAKGPKLAGESLSLVDQILSEIDLNEDLSIQDAKGNEMYQVVDLIKPEPMISEQGACGECGCRKCVCETGEVEKWEDSEEAHEDLEESDHKGEKKYCKKCKKKETRDECKYGGKVWDRMTSDDDDDDSEDSGDVSEAVRMKARTGNLVAVILTWRGKSLMVRMFFPSLNYPSRSEVEAEVIKIYPGARVINYRRIEVTPGSPVVHVGEEVEMDEKVDLTKQSSKRKSLGRGSSIKDGSKPRGYESPKEFRDAEKKFSEAKIDEIHMLTPKLKKNTSTTEKKSKSDANRYGEDPEDYAKRMRKKQKEYASRTEEKNVHGEIEVPSGNLKKLVSKAVKRIDTDVDGDVEHNDQHKGEYGEFLPTPFGKFKTGGAKPSSKRTKK